MKRSLGCLEKLQTLKKACPHFPYRWHHVWDFAAWVDKRFKSGNVSNGSWYGTPQKNAQGGTQFRKDKRFWSSLLINNLEPKRCLKDSKTIKHQFRITCFFHRWFAKRSNLEKSLKMSRGLIEFWLLTNIRKGLDHFCDKQGPKAASQWQNEGFSTPVPTPTTLRQCRFF